MQTDKLHGLSFEKMLEEVIEKDKEIVRKSVERQDSIEKGKARKGSTERKASRDDCKEVVKKHCKTLKASDTLRDLVDRKDFTKIDTGCEGIKNCVVHYIDECNLHYEEFREKKTEVKRKFLVNTEKELVILCDSYKKDAKSDKTKVERFIADQICHFQTEQLDYSSFPCARILSYYQREMLKCAAHASNMKARGGHLHTLLKSFSSAQSPALQSICDDRRSKEMQDVIQNCKMAQKLLKKQGIDTSLLDKGINEIVTSPFIKTKTYCQVTELAQPEYEQAGGSQAVDNPSSVISKQDKKDQREVLQKLKALHTDTEKTRSDISSTGSRSRFFSLSVLGASKIKEEEKALLLENAL